MTTENSQIPAWQREIVRNNMARYRAAQEGYYVADKPTVTVGNGFQAFSLLTPPLGSPINRRRVKHIMQDMLHTTPRPDQTMFPYDKRTPHVVTMALTYNCQCHCEHCSAVDYQQQTRCDGTALTNAELKDAIAQCLDLGTTCMVFTGGEPLLVPTLPELIREVPPARAICTMFTNGEHLTEAKVRELKAAGLYGAFVSLDDPDPAVHDQNRSRPGLFAKATAGIAECQKAGILTGISTFATREKMNNGGLDAMMELGKRLGVVEVFIFDAIPVGKLGGCPDTALTAEENEWLRAFRLRYNARSEYPRILHQTMFTTIAYPCLAEGCPAAVMQLHLRANGDVSPCDFTPHSFGNIRQQPLREIWKVMTASTLYAGPSPRCRMSQAEFRSQLAAVAERE
jgi:MoaA/NifB/PqqE/SkfB family radical SAM enzyme